MRRAARVDANHTAVMTALGGMGCAVQSLAALGAGVPDLLVGYRGETYLIEIKDGDKSASRRKLTDAQQKWHAWWRGRHVIVVNSPDEAIQAVCGVEMPTVPGWVTYYEVMRDV